MSADRARAGDPLPRAAACQTCADAAVEVRVVSVEPDTAMALCTDRDGAALAVDTGLLIDVSAGECLLVHAGAAIARVPA